LYSLGGRQELIMGTSPLLTLVLLLLVRGTNAFFIKERRSSIELPPADGLRIDGLNPSRFTPPTEVGLVLAVDNPNPVLSWWIPPPSSFKNRGLRVNTSRLSLKLASENEDGKLKEVWSRLIVSSSSSGRNYRYDGPALQPATQYCFAVSYQSGLDGNWAKESELACFEMGLGADPKSWLPSTWIGDDELKVLRSEFKIPTELLEKAKAARLYVSGSWGQYYINGEQISTNESLGVGWTRYDKRCYYATYSILPLLKKSENVVGATLGQGWRDTVAFPPKFQAQDESTGIDLGFRARANIEQITPGRGNLSDGFFAVNPSWTQRTVRMLINLQTTDGKWHTVAYTNKDTWEGTLGPVLNDSIFNGETYDAREAVKIAGFSTPEYQASASDWTTVADISYETWVKTTKLVAQPIPPIRVQESVRPYSIKLVEMSDDGKKGHFLIDFWKNRAGVCRVKLPKGEKGSNITLRHAEVVMHEPYGYYGQDGKYLYYENLRSAKATDVYIFNGDEEEEGQFWQPSFTYHGFRHLELIGWPCGVGDGGDNAAGDADDDDFFGKPMWWTQCANPPQIEMIHFRTDVEQHGHIQTSDDMINSYWKMVVGSLDSNIMSVPTDCPQRDERLGWMGDTGSSADISAMVYDIAPFHDGFLDLIEDDMLSNGTIPDVVPFYRYGNQQADPSWSSAFIFVLFSRFHISGNLEPYKKHRDSVKLYLDNMFRQYEERGRLAMMVATGDLWGTYGEWEVANETDRPPHTFVSAFNWILTLQQASEMAESAGDAHLAKLYAKNASDISREFLQVYYHEDQHSFEFGSQTELALALRLNILNEDEAADVGDFLNHRLQADGEDQGNWTVGMYGFKYILQSLTKSGHADTAYSLLKSTPNPSVGFMLLNDFEPASTNLWEVWDAIHQDATGNSRQHHMYSTLGTYLYELAGVVGNQEHGFGYSQQKPLQLAVQGVINNLTHACSKSKNAFGPFEFCWSAPSFDGVIPDDDPPSSSHFTVTLPTGSYANITMPLLQTKHHRAKRLRIVESENVIFEGTVDRDSMDLPHAPLPGLDSLSFNFESYTLDFIVSSGKFNFSLSQQPVSN